MNEVIYTVKNRETIADVAASVGFTAAYIQPLANPTYALIQAVDDDVRICIDGTAPTATKGIRLTEDSTIEVWGSTSLINFRVIDDGGTAKLEVIYYGGGGV